MSTYFVKGTAVSMWKSLTIAALCACCLVAGSLQADSVEKVDFRLMEWKSFHFDEAAKAKEYHDTFKSLGCECKQESHGDHFDVSFRCPKWRSLNLKSHTEAHKWEDFLKKAGFETKHEH
ncbi:MAG: hypothetical protein H6821_04985 [Planctomycetaceae bacterium]|nr:hypothetical protein [Planctomycetales bacterium]MCB9873516.1 hypothetical protein [Planctomycetaceae bacterium]MCB9940426.1 hypothetical protein [Planctomycetaceae bacterium]